MLKSGWLIGWEEVAEYLGRSIRTAKTYYYRYSLPIRHDPGGHVIALRSEIDKWRIEFDNKKTITCLKS